MAHDAQELFSDGQAVTAAAASTNFIDLQAARQLGPGNEVYVVVKVVTAMNDAGSNSTLAVTIETDDNSSFSSATSAQTIGTFAATSAVGTQFVVPVANFTTAERYMRLYYTPANGNLNAGAFDAYLTETPQLDTIYPNSYTITA